MPIKQDTPQNLKPFMFHGLDFTWGGGSSQATGECFVCGKEGKFFVSIDTGQWDCKSCGESGNATSFLWRLHELSLPAPGRPLSPAYEELAQERWLLSPDTLLRWGLCPSAVDGVWLVPAYSPNGKICQLYRYSTLGGRRRLMATPADGETAALLRSHATTGEGRGTDTRHGLAGLHLMGKRVTRLYVCEGVWDAMALWEVMSQAKWAGEGPGTGLVPTGNRASSLLADSAIVATPSCNVWPPAWAPTCAGRDVVFLFDSDHPVKQRGPSGHDGRETAPAGLAGCQRAVRTLSVAEAQPSSVNYLQWGPRGFDPQLKSGFDVRDWLTCLDSKDKVPDLRGRLARLGALLAKVVPTPTDWLGADGSGRRGKAELGVKPCTRWDELVKAWRLDLKFTDGLNCALSCMLATITSTRAVGDQLWMKIIGPPSCGKSVLCEALSVSKKYIVPLSTLRGFHSGYKVDSEASEDVSLLSRLKDKTLVTKDGDTLLQSPNLGQILSEARDVYDRVSRASYKNKVNRVYEGLNMTWLLCGTESLRSLDSSELGERFLDYIIVDEMEEDMEEEIGLRVAYRAEQDVAFESNGRPEGQHSPSRIEAMRLTGGYVEYLRTNAQRLLSGVKMPDWAIGRCTKLGRFVSYMRARPSTRQGEKAQRELSFRLISQHVRLAKCLAVVLNHKEVDSEVMRRLRKVALDTSRGRSLNLLRAMAREGDAGLSVEQAAWLCNETKREETHLVHFLWKIGVIESYRQANGRGGYFGPNRWRLTGTLKRLYAEVMADDSLLGAQQTKSARSASDVRRTPDDASRPTLGGRGGDRAATSNKGGDLVGKGRPPAPKRDGGSRC